MKILKTKMLGSVSKGQFFHRVKNGVLKQIKEHEGAFTGAIKLTHSITLNASGGKVKTELIFF